MGMWRDEPASQNKPSNKHEYEAVGYVISGQAELLIEGQMVRLDERDLQMRIAAGAPGIVALEVRLSHDLAHDLDPKAETSGPGAHGCLIP
jgi:hypothetical protein